MDYKALFLRNAVSQSTLNDRDLVRKIADLNATDFWSGPIAIKYLATIMDRLQKDGEDKHPELSPVAEIMARYPDDHLDDAGFLHRVHSRFKLELCDYRSDAPAQLRLKPKFTL